MFFNGANGIPRTFITINSNQLKSYILSQICIETKPLCPLWLHSTQRHLNTMIIVERKVDEALNNCYPDENDEYEEFIKYSGCLYGR